MISYPEDCCTRLPASPADLDGLTSSILNRLTTQRVDASVIEHQLKFTAEIQRLPESRRQLIFRVRRQIAEGTYDSDEKLEIALGRLFETHLQDESEK